MPNIYILHVQSTQKSIKIMIIIFFPGEKAEVEKAYLIIEPEVEPKQITKDSMLLITNFTLSGQEDKICPNYNIPINDFYDIISSTDIKYIDTSKSLFIVKFSPFAKLSYCY